MGSGIGADLCPLSKLAEDKVDLQRRRSNVKRRNTRQILVDQLRSIWSPAGTAIPGSSPAAVTPAPITTQANMFTYLFGPQVTYRTSKANIFGELLFGGSNSNAYANVAEALNGVGANVATGTQHPFTMAFGGGVDVKVSKNIAIRPVEIDYLLTRYTNPFTQTNNQNNFRYVAGIVFYLGGK